MAPREKPTFLLYEIGRDPEELCLGNLVLKDYANPTISRHYTHPRLNEDDLETHARSTRLTKGWEVKSSSGTTFKPSMDVADLFQTGINWDRKHERTLTADEGCRIVLKDPERFLHQQVLCQVDAVQALQIWISGANRNLGDLIKKPKIWLLTGIYLLRDATFTGEKKRRAGVQAGVNSTVLSAIGAPPIGPSIDLERSSDSSSQTPTQGWLVWAAQYFALDYRACSRVFRSADITLLDNVVSNGMCYLSGPDWQNGLTVEVAEHSNSLDESAQSACNDEDYQKITENLQTCETSPWLTKEEPFYVLDELTPEQRAKHMRWQQTEEEIRGAVLWVDQLQQMEYLDNFEELKQSAHNQILVAEKEHKQAFTDFKSSLSETQALKE